MPDNDYCLQVAPGWGPHYSCSDGKPWCDSWAKDMQRCCSTSCSTNELTEPECISLSSAGSCVYPRPESTTPTMAPTTWGEDYYWYYYNLARESDIASDSNSHGGRRLLIV
jgi:hypothetical protein